MKVEISLGDLEIVSPLMHVSGLLSYDGRAVTVADAGIARFEELYKNGDLTLLAVSENEKRIKAAALAQYQGAVESHVDGVAQDRGYSSAVSCASYVGSTVPQWASEAAAFIAWRDAVWVDVYRQLEAVQGGDIPPSVGDLIAALPAIVWPE